MTPIRYRIKSLDHPPSPVSVGSGTFDAWAAKDALGTFIVDDSTQANLIAVLDGDPRFERAGGGGTAGGGSFVDDKAKQADVNAALANTAAISELIAPAYANNTESAQNNDYIFVAPFTCKVAACTCFFSTTMTGTSTDHWRFDLNRVRATVFNTIASKSNWGGDGAGGASIQPNVEWNFDGISFNAANQILQKGDACVMTHVPTGTLGTGGFVSFTRRVFTVRYEPIG